jgi:hypothetical protein
MATAAHRRTPGVRWQRWTRALGALALLGVGLDHLDEYAVAHYSAIPTIGTLFLLDFASAALLAVAFAVRPWRLFAAAGIAVAAGSLAGLLASEHVALFGFREVGYRPAVVLAIALDVVAIALLAPHAVARG